jgi:hypothetical protein
MWAAPWLGSTQHTTRAQLSRRSELTSPQALSPENPVLTAEARADKGAAARSPAAAKDERSEVRKRLVPRATLRIADSVHGVASAALPLVAKERSGAAEHSRMLAAAEERSGASTTPSSQARGRQGTAASRAQPPQRPSAAWAPEPRVRLYCSTRWRACRRLGRLLSCRWTAAAGARAMPALPSLARCTPCAEGGRPAGATRVTH